MSRIKLKQVKASDLIIGNEYYMLNDAGSDYQVKVKFVHRGQTSNSFKVIESYEHVTGVMLYTFATTSLYELSND